MIVRATRGPAMRAAVALQSRALSSNSARWEEWCQQPVIAALDEACAPMTTAEFWRTTGANHLISPTASARMNRAFSRRSTSSVIRLATRLESALPQKQALARRCMRRARCPASSSPRPVPVADLRAVSLK